MIILPHRGMLMGGSRPPVFTKLGTLNSGGVQYPSATFSNVPAGLLLIGAGSAQANSTSPLTATIKGSTINRVVGGYSNNTDLSLFVYENTAFEASLTITINHSKATARSGMSLVVIENSPWVAPADTTKFMGASTGFLSIPAANSLVVAAATGSGAQSFTVGADDFEGGSPSPFTDGVVLGWAVVGAGDHTMTANAGKVLVGAGYS